MKTVVVSLLLTLFSVTFFAQTDNWVLVDHYDFEIGTPVPYVIGGSLNDWNEYPQSDQCVPEGDRALLMNFRDDFVGLSFNRPMDVCPGAEYYFSWQKGNCYLNENNNPSFVKPHVRIVVEDGDGTIHFDNEWANLTNWITAQTTPFIPNTSTIYFQIYTVIPGHPFGNDMVFDDLRLFQNNPEYSYVDDNGSAIELCSGDAPINLIDYFVFPESNGTWGGPSTLGNGSLGTFDPASNVSGDYTFTTAGATGCPDTTSVFAVAVGVTPELDLVEDRIECGIYVLPAIEGNDLSGNQAYFSNPNGAGTRYEIGDIITETITLYVYDEDPNSSICNDETSFTITILDAPNAGVDYSTLFCTGDVNGSITLSDNLGTHDNNGEWTETSSTASGVFVSASSELNLPSMTEGEYTFIYVVPAVGDCEADTSFHTISILETPEIDWSLSATEGCLPETISFSAGTTNNPNFEYNWSFGNGESSTLANPEVNYTTTGCFDVSLSVSNNGQCAVNQSQSDLICIYPNPTANFTMDQDSLDATSPILTGDNLSVGADSYVWVFGDGSTSSEVDLYHNFSNAEGGYIDVTLIAFTDQGCSDTLTQQIFMFNQFTLEIPNVFTPNNDGANDLFTVYVEGTRLLEWSVFNRWGNVLSVGKEELTSGGQIVTIWDGFIDGEVAAEGVYFYRLSYENYFDESGTEHGHVTVVR